MNHDIIHKFCRYHNIKKYTINNDDSIDVNDSVVFINSRMKIIPIKFNKVYGKFYCNFNDSLITTKGFSTIVGSNISIRFCPKLTSLEDYNLSYEKLDIDNKEKIIRKVKLNKLISYDIR